MTICPQTKSLEYPVYWTIRHLDNAPLEQSIPRSTCPMPDVSLGRRIPDRYVPTRVKVVTGQFGLCRVA